MANFFILSAASAFTLALSGKVQAQAMVTETDPQTAALSYKADASKVEKVKYQKFAARRTCSNCTLINVKQVMLLMVVHCLVPNKLLVQAGALLTLRRLNSQYGVPSF